MTRRMLKLGTLPSLIIVACVCLTTWIHEIAVGSRIRNFTEPVLLPGFIASLSVGGLGHSARAVEAFGVAIAVNSVAWGAAWFSVRALSKLAPADRGIQCPSIARDSLSRPTRRRSSRTR